MVQTGILGGISEIDVQYLEKGIYLITINGFDNMDKAYITRFIKS